jgi:hypothetical protein
MQSRHLWFPVARQRSLLSRDNYMSQITSETFEQAVMRYFEPISKAHEWSLVRKNADIYEMQSPHFTMQIRFGVGMHSKNIDAILVPAIQNVKAGIEKSGGSFGVLAIAGYNGVTMEINPRQQTEDGFFEYTKYVATMAEHYGVPYMLGQKSDSAKVINYWRKESEIELEKIKGYKFAPSVQKRWHLPPPSKEESGR